MATKHARRFLVGYKGEGGTIVWGQQFFPPCSCRPQNFTDHCRQMTLLEAKAAIGQLPSPNPVIFELVPMED